MDNRSKRLGESVDLDQNRGLNLCLHLKNNEVRDLKKLNRTLKLGRGEYLLMPCPFTGPKMFSAGPNFLSHLTAFRASSKTFCEKDNQGSIHIHMTSDVLGVFLTYLPTLIRYFTT